MNTIRVAKLMVSAAAMVILAGGSASAADAASIWATNCAACHGKDGKAATMMGKKLSVRDLTDSKVQASFSDAQATSSIKDGVKQDGKVVMKGFGGKLSDADIKALVAYIRGLK